MVLKYNLHHKASLELNEAVAWYFKEGGKSLASRFLKEYRETRSKIIKNPLLFGGVGGEYRQAAFNKFPFVIVYYPTNVEVFILAIFHTSRDSEKWKARIS